VSLRVTHGIVQAALHGGLVAQRIEQPPQKPKTAYPFCPACGQAMRLWSTHAARGDRPGAAKTFWCPEDVFILRHRRDEWIRMELSESGDLVPVGVETCVRTTVP
jgi:hypothetical protein